MLTPLDVRKQQFRKALSGFDPDEVRAFLGLVAGEMERLVKEQAALAEQASQMKGRLEEYQTLERSLRDAVVAAQGMRDESRRHAEREAELILAKAELEAEGRLRQSEIALTDLKREMAALRSERQSYLIRLRALIDTHMRMVEASEARFEAMERTAGGSLAAAPHQGAPPIGTPLAGPPLGSLAGSALAAESPRVEIRDATPAPREPEAWRPVETPGHRS